MGIFKDCSIVLELKNLPIKEKNNLKALIKENGGSVTYVINKKCTHVVANCLDHLSPNRKKSIDKFQIPVVTTNYIFKCCDEKNLLNVQEYTSAETILHKQSKDNAVEIDIIPLLDEFPRKPLEIVKENSVDLFRIYTENEPNLPKFSSEFEVAKYAVLLKTTGSEISLAVIEVQCATETQWCPFRVTCYSGELQNEQVKRKKKELIFSSTSEVALRSFGFFMKNLQKDGFVLQKKLPAAVKLLASEKLQKVLLEEALSSSIISQEVGVFVELIWTAAHGCLNEVLSCPINSISPNDVIRAEGVLHRARKAMESSCSFSDLKIIMSEFFRIIPHKCIAEPFINMRTISQKQDLCQLIRDIVNVSESTFWSPTPSSLAKYRALRCSIEHLEPETEEYFNLTKLLTPHGKSFLPVTLHRIFHVSRVDEMLDFQRKLGNVQLLFHASSLSKFVGILSRGLLLPKVAVEQHGIARTDVGNLGSGIYFSNDIRTAMKYSSPNEIDGTCILVVCEVALGLCKQLTQKDCSLTSAPDEYHSVHGVRNTPQKPTEFEDDEFVVYNINQIQMKYVIQFCLDKDSITIYEPQVNLTGEEVIPYELDAQVTDTDSNKEHINPLLGVTAGLQDSSGNQIPLESVHIKGRMMDLLAQVVVFQTYTNHSSTPIEAKYVFPLDETAAVCGFEAFINGKHVIGEVKEKEEARQEYQQAIREGHGAYLMDQDAPDVFTISVGNLPPEATVLIKITYVTELSVNFGLISFRLPGSVAPWQQSKALNEKTQDTLEKVKVSEFQKEGGFMLDMSVEMPYEIQEIWSETHNIDLKKTECKAVIRTKEGSSLGSDGFSLSVRLSELYLPRMWVEKHPDKESQACMLVFCPAFDSNSLPEGSEVVILLDNSNSMKGSKLQEAKQIAVLALEALECKTNVIMFGTDYNELFPYPEDIHTGLAAAKTFILGTPELMGNTDLWRPLRNLSLLPPSKGLRNILLISDGHLQNEGLTLRLVTENVCHTRVFTCGIGSTANRHMLRTLAHSGGGAYEFFDTKTKYTWKDKISSQVKRMASPACTSVSVKWQQFNQHNPKPIQAPAQLHSLFSENQLLLYGFVPHCTQATLYGKISNQEIETMVSTTELQKTKGTMLHKLTARALIRDYEEGILHADGIEHEAKKSELKPFIISLSKEYSIVTQYTSFIAVEKRDVDKQQDFSETNITELISQEDIDCLPYLGWEQDLKAASIFSEEDSDSGSSSYVLDYLNLFSDIHPCAEDVEDISLKMDFRSGFAEYCEMDSFVQDYREISSDIFVSKRAVKEIIPAVDGLPLPPPPPPPPPPDLPEGMGMSRIILHDMSTECSTSEPLESFLLHRGSSVRANRRKSRRYIPAFDEGSDHMAQGLHMKLSGLSGISSTSGPPASILPHNVPFGLTQAREQDLQDSLPLCAKPCLPAQQMIQPSPPLLGVVVPKTPKFGQAMTQKSPQITGIMSFGERQIQQSPPIAESAFFKSSFNQQRLSFPMITGKSSFHQPSPPVPGQLFGQATIQPSLLFARSEADQCDLIQPSRSFTRYMSPAPGAQPVLHSSLPLFEKMHCAGFSGGFGASTNIMLKPSKSSYLLPEFMHTDPQAAAVKAQRRKQDLVSWANIFLLQHVDGYWEATSELGALLDVNMDYFANVFLKEKGIMSLGLKAKENILRLLATLLVIQLIRYTMQLNGIVLKSLFHLEHNKDESSPYLLSVEKAIKWAKAADKRYPCICSRLQIGRDMETTTRQLLNIDPIKENSPLWLFITKQSISGINKPFIFGNSTIFGTSNQQSCLGMGSALGGFSFETFA
ncbi:PARP4 polymerase, partial [Polypterus senegalus]|nr:protein mono-ADP-ribosyltransferase PARP4 [Polypterus senegalus]MBN3294535.1 PARP4 polymerase [Polypterus senegalus]